MHCGYPVLLMVNATRMLTQHAVSLLLEASAAAELPNTPYALSNYALSNYLHMRLRTELCVVRDAGY